ncbi:MAG: nitroreductase family protein [Candidatus Omnitrophota bacterium]
MIKDIVKQSRSYRRFDGKVKIPGTTLRELIELARFSPSARNQQALKFMISDTPEKNDLIFPALSWAGSLKGWEGPKEDERPAAYIIVLGDSQASKDFGCDHGIAAQSMLLGAVEKGFGGCMLGAIKRDLLRENLKIPQRYKILLVVALGKPAEKIVLEDTEEGAGTEYYRDEKDVHHVPKRPLDELIIS